MPPSRLTAMLDGERAITVDTAIRLGKAVGTSAEIWMGLQASHDLVVARRGLPADPSGARRLATVRKVLPGSGRRIVRGIRAKRRTA